MTSEEPARIPARRQHPAFLVIATGQALRAVIPVLIGIAIIRTHLWTLAVVVALAVGWAVASFLTRTYSVAGGELRVRSGVLSKTVRSVPIRRITAVDASRGLVHRLLGIWTVRVQTPGDGDKDTVTLHGMSAPALHELRAALAGDDRSPGTTAPPPPEQEIARLGAKELVIAALTGTSVPLLLAGGAAVWSRARELLPTDPVVWVTGELMGHSAWGIVVLVAAALVLATLAGVLFTALRLSGFTLIREPDRLRITRGLGAQRAGTVVVDRVQAIRIVEGTWRRLLGYCAVEVEVAGVSGRSKDGPQVLFPLVRTDRVADLIDRALPELGWQAQDLTRVPKAARRRYLQLPVLPAAAAAAGLALLPGWWALWAVVPLPLGIWIGLGQARDAGWWLDEATVVLRGRRLSARHTVVARRRRVQLTRLTETVFQRRARLAGIQVSFSSARHARLRHLDLATATTLLHRVGRAPATTPLAADGDPRSG